TLVVYSYMFGPQRERPCPMCTSLLGAWDGEVPDIQQRVALAVVARSPIERLKAFKRERGWHYLPLYQDLSGEFSRDYHALTKDGGDDAAFNVFTKRDGKIRHFWGGEMNAASADPGQDPRGAPDLMPLWTILDVTPEGRGTEWYPQLDSANFDSPVVKRTVLAVRSAPSAADTIAAALPEPAPVISTPASMPSRPLLSFDDRFAAAAPQSVDPAAPPEPPKLAEAARPKESSAASAPVQVAAIAPAPAPRAAEARAPKNPGAAVR